ncbi:fatty acid elongase 3-ketoacyl-CoA synthase [Heterostelium album PN500]|uniref:3-ketoacyl-CoA synthase n=1 Tax=Heterostelium pallidum (strain ATCC 26659 / Pp 5 / PN500) TaxID=670386 RepID=D3BVP7_HETP5|nr:fatty acid elongase 3-ketoacyl-CoA synthase [Heterostelium album PN500]EFA74550.1 fatty acid elongase 3-ketoacyl-CoA synthase [Heterostelium album PN500]|eukprot:XP_020426684.1 fatty acid elongase 3-ketoacyl-CoA synthase [Heterostelium album PN500]
MDKNNNNNNEAGSASGDKSNSSNTAAQIPEVKSYYYPDRDANLTEVKTGYSAWKTNSFMSFIVLLVPVIVINVLYVYNKGDLFVDLISKFQEMIIHEFRNQEPQTIYVAITIAFVSLLLIELVISVLMSKRRKPVYLVDFSVFQPDDKYKITHDFFIKHTERVGWFDQDSIEFQKKLLYRTGLGNDTYFPAGITKDVPDTSMESARQEADMVLSGCLDDLFAKTKIKPTDIDILIVNCSLFNPTPSLAAMMRHDILSYNLSGMGCSASVVSIDLAKQLLQVHKNATAVVLSTENITQNWYRGNEKAMLLTNTLFRMGGAAIMLSNKSKYYWSGKYKLVTSVRVTKSTDTAYNAVYQTEDCKGNKGVRLATGRDLMAVVGDALKTNLTILGPMVLPWSEQIKFFLHLCYRKFVNKKAAPYVPDFKKAFDHYCIHAGGRAVIDGLEENFKLSPYDVEPSRATLYRYGNTSSSSIWYELNFIEKQHHVKSGEKVWQLAFGSGFKCNSAVWEAIRDI